MSGWVFQPLVPATAALATPPVTPLTEFFLLEGGGATKPSFLALMGVGGTTSQSAEYILLEDGTSKLGLE